jgi:hypothetical protein
MACRSAFLEWELPGRVEPPSTPNLATSPDELVLVDDSEVLICPETSTILSISASATFSRFMGPQPQVLSCRRADLSLQIWAGKMNGVEDNEGQKVKVEDRVLEKENATKANDKMEMEEVKMESK